MNRWLSLKASPWGLLSAGIVLVGLGTLAGFLSPLAWWLELAEHFRIQYLLLAGLCALLFGLGRKRRWAAACAGLTLVNLAVVAPLFFGPRAPSVPAERRARVLLLNVNTDRGDPAAVVRLIRQTAPDVIVLEEVSDRWISALATLRDRYPHQTVAARDDNFGIALFSRHPFLNAEIVYLGDAGVPSVVGTVAMPDGPITIVGTHPLPPGTREYAACRNRQLAALPACLRNIRGPLLVLGDLNVTPWSYYFRKLLRETRLRDSSRGHGLQPTWPTYVWALRIPIDHCLYNEDVRILDRRIGGRTGSDHFPVIVDFAYR